MASLSRRLITCEGKQVSSNHVYLLAVVLHVLVFVCPAMADGHPVVLTTGEWPPFYSENLPHGGIGNRIVAESFAKTGIKVDFRYQPWIRALQTARYGPASGSAGWLRMPEREKHFLYSDSLFTSRRVFFHLRDVSFDWETLADVKDLRIAVTLGSADEFPFDEVMASGSGKVDLAQSYASGMKKLAAGRVDVYACNLDVGLYVLQNQVTPEEAALITHHPRSIFEETNHLILSRRVLGAHVLMARFNAGLRLLKETGRHDWILNDLQGRIPVQQPE